MEVSLIPAGEELDSFSAKAGRGFLTGLSQESWVKETCDLATIEWLIGYHIDSANLSHVGSMAATGLFLP